MHAARTPERDTSLFSCLHPRSALCKNLGQLSKLIYSIVQRQGSCTFVKLSGEPHMLQQGGVAKRLQHSGLAVLSDATALQVQVGQRCEC